MIHLTLVDITKITLHEAHSHLPFWDSILLVKDFCAKRYVRREWLNPNFPSVLRPSFVRKIIDFCRKDMKGFHILRSLDETQQRFLATPKVNLHLTRLATGKRTLRDPFLDPVLVTFFNKVNKNVTDANYRASRLQMDTKWVFENVTWVKRDSAGWHSRRG